ncbi:DUF982 domain-containing protein [Phyllobacterium sp. SB3]|uniref:DUF982 domain-containing protein n=1 Tax=Phyllobacterium sp. SB3 TaxID=3156073 RepID=UPI0032AF79DC
MNHLTFQPVVVESNNFGRKETITSISDAAAFLLSGWPRKKASLYMEARVLCYEAQSGIASVDAARLIFVEAAIEADIYVKEGH